MRRILLFFAVFSFSLTSKGQCDPPQIIEWNAFSEVVYQITFYAPNEGNYILTVHREYDDEVQLDFVIEATQGINTTLFDFTTLLETENGENHFITSTLKWICEFPEVAQTRFYMSHHSLLNDSENICDSLFMPIEHLSEESNSTVETVLSFPSDIQTSGPLKIFVDIGHENNADLSIELEHPSGLAITLLDSNSAFNGTQGLSIIFSDDASELPYSLNDVMGPRGIFQPAEPLSTFDGLPMEGDWILRVTDHMEQNNGLVFGACFYPLCNARIEGTVFMDFNSDGLQNENDMFLSFANVENSIDGSQFYTNMDGDFSRCSDTGNGILEVQNAPDYFSPEAININLEEGDQIENILIPIIPNELVSDIDVDLISTWYNRPGFTTHYIARVRNWGTICEEDISLEITFPDYVQISAWTTDVLTMENTASIEIDELCPFNSNIFDLSIYIDSAVSLGTILEASIAANVSENDANELNNTHTSSEEIVGSYDPNDKQVSAETIGDDFLESESPLKYTIRFQNTGTFYAERVEILDTIDADLDINSLQIISTSHDMELSREGNVLTFEFDQIFLPDSTTDFEGSIGHVRYEIDPLPSFSEGDLIENTAYIYFDFNEPIVTNTVVTEFGNPLSTTEEISKVSLYPNPTNDRIIATWNSDFNPQRAEIFDLTGRLLMEELTQGSNLLEIDVSELPQGLYIIRFVSEGLVSESKFVKE